MAATACQQVVFGSVVAFLLGTPGATEAQTCGGEQPSREVRIEASPVKEPHIRTTDAFVRTLVKAGAARSETLRRLLAQLEASDVVAYVRIDGNLPGHLDGRTWFVAAAAGTRYVEIALRPTGQALSTAVLFAHELAHAIEVVTDPGIVDPQSMADRFLSMGNARRHRTRTLVETNFALGIGANVKRELTPFLADLAAAVR